MDLEDRSKLKPVPEDIVKLLFLLALAPLTLGCQKPKQTETAEPPVDNAFTQKAAGYQTSVDSAQTAVDQMNATIKAQEKAYQGEE